MTVIISTWSDERISELYAGLTDCIESVAAQRPDIVPSLVQIPFWSYEDTTLLKRYRNMMTRLVSHNSHHSGMVLSHLIGQGFIRDLSSEFVHGALQHLLAANPNVGSAIRAAIGGTIPVATAPTDHHTSFVTNMLAMTRYARLWETDLLDCILQSLVIIDVEIKPELLADDDTASSLSTPDESMRGMSVDASGRFVSSHEAFSPRHKILADEGGQADAATFVMAMAERLDAALYILFDWLRVEAGSSTERAHEVLDHITPGFTRRILKAHRAKYVQFVAFYLCSVDPSLCSPFLASLFHVIYDTAHPLGTRQSAAYYIGSFVARAAFVPVATVALIIETIMASIAAEVDILPPDAAPDVFARPMFYTLCQTVFYMACFHSHDLLDPMGHGAGAGLFGRDGTLRQAIDSPLRPFAVCFRPVVEQFAGLCASHGAMGGDIADVCDRDGAWEMHSFNTDMSSAVRADLVETFFPFDPFQLERGAVLIDPIYREWGEEEVEEEVRGHPMGMEGVM